MWESRIPFDSLKMIINCLISIVLDVLEGSGLLVSPSVYSMVSRMETANVCRSSHFIESCEKVSQIRYIFSYAVPKRGQMSG